MHHSILRVTLAIALHTASVASVALAITPVGASPAAAIVTSPQAADKNTARAVPRVDHHQHLQSPARAQISNGPRDLPAITLPADLANLLRMRETHWNDADALAGLYAKQPLLLVNQGIKSGFGSSPQTAARYLTTRFQQPYRLTPVAFHKDRSTAAITGYYSAGSAPELNHFGFFHLLLNKDNKGAWKINAEIPAFRDGQREKPITAKDMVAMLDAAGVERAVILSAGFGFGARADLEGVGEPTSVRYTKVRAENDWTAEQVSQFPDRLIAFCGFSPIESFALAELDRCATSGKFKGLKFTFDESMVDLQNPAHVEKVRAVFAAANRRRIPMVVHVGNNRGPVEQNKAAVSTFLRLVSSAAPDVTVQVAHLWGGQAFSPSALGAYTEAMESKAAGTKNLYFDMSEAAMIGSNYGKDVLKTIADSIRRIGPDRVLFGSDTTRRFQKQAPKEAWAQFRSDIPLTDAEFNVIANNVAPYLR